MRLWTLLVLLAATSAEPVTIKTSPQSFFAGATITVTCTVPRHADNRGIDAVVTGYTSSHRDINGEDAPVTYRFEFKHVPCDAVEAVCALADNHQRVAIAKMPLNVAGCEP